PTRRPCAATPALLPFQSLHAWRPRRACAAARTATAALRLACVSCAPFAALPAAVAAPRASRASGGRAFGARPSLQALCLRLTTCAMLVLMLHRAILAAPRL